MLHSAQHRVLFTHVSRTGGVAFVQVLRELLPDLRVVGGQHSFLAQLRPVLGPDFEEARRVAFVRNPWDRFVSWYALIGKTLAGTHWDPAALADPESAHWREFDAFLELWSGQTEEVEGRSLLKLSQWAQLSDPEGQMLATEVGRYENLAGDVARILGELGFDPAPVQRVNASVHRHYSHYYSAFGRELVGEVYRADVEGFGYQFEEPSHP